MAHPPPDEVRRVDADELLPIVVGAHLEAEAYDRAFGERLRTVIAGRGLPDAGPRPPVPLVMSDVWYLNEPKLRVRPTIAVGRPDLNAATAYLSRKLPTALLIEGSCRIQLDPEFIDPFACLWGTTPKRAGDAMEVFIDRYLDGFLEAAELASLD